MPFYKYHGTGNDFILIDDRQLKVPHSEEFIRRICHRRFGIGADGLILLRNEPGYDFRMVYFNSDGKESTMCGNGGRCIIAFADFLSLIGDEARFMAIDGEHRADILHRSPGLWQVRLTMSAVKSYRVVRGDYILDTGSPHLVRFVEKVSSVDVVATGRGIRFSEEFSPAGINADFAEESGKGLHVRTYERGVEDETLSCGTGVTASALAFAIRKGISSGTVPLLTAGGELAVAFKRQGEGFTNISLEGPACLVYKGLISSGPEMTIL